MKWARFFIELVFFIFIAIPIFCLVYAGIHISFFIYQSIKTVKKWKTTITLPFHRK